MTTREYNARGFSTNGLSRHQIALTMELRSKGWTWISIRNHLARLFNVRATPGEIAMAVQLAETRYGI
jgi:hypothetical protein